MPTLKKLLYIAFLAGLPTVVNAQLAVTISPPKVTLQKAVVRLTMRNGLVEKIESARATVFLLDDQGKMLANASRWVIGGTKADPGLAPGATNVFNFVVGTAKPITSTNLNTKVTFSRIVLEGGKVADPIKSVDVKPAPQ
jgi:hypothetical protein